MSVNSTHTMTHAVTCIIEESWTVRFKNSAQPKKIAVYMSAEIQPKKIRLAEIWAVFFPSKPNLKKIGLGV